MNLLTGTIIALVVVFTIVEFYTPKSGGSGSMDGDYNHGPR